MPSVADLPPVVPAGGALTGGVLGGVPGGVPGGTPGGVLGGVLGGLPTVAPPPPPVETQPEPPKKPRPVSTGILLGNSLRRVSATYPPAARAARIQDTVQVEVVIDGDGNVTSAQAISGNPLLRKAAVDAALQWKFRPTLLNGRPTQVTGVLNFNFRLEA